MILVLITSASSDGPDEPAHMRSLVKAFAACIHKRMVIDEDSDKTVDLLSNWIHRHWHFKEVFAHMR